jgi:hypothetical protein
MYICIYGFAWSQQRTTSVATDVKGTSLLTLFKRQLFPHCTIKYFQVRLKTKIFKILRFLSLSHAYEWDHLLHAEYHCPVVSIMEVWNLLTFLQWWESAIKLFKCIPYNGRISNYKLRWRVPRMDVPLSKTVFHKHQYNIGILYYHIHK